MFQPPIRYQRRRDVEPSTNPHHSPNNLTGERTERRRGSFNTEIKRREERTAADYASSSEKKRMRLNATETSIAETVDGSVGLTLPLDTYNYQLFIIICVISACLPKHSLRRELCCGIVLSIYISNHLVLHSTFIYQILYTHYLSLGIVRLFYTFIKSYPLALGIRPFMVILCYESKCIL